MSSKSWLCALLMAIQVISRVSFRDIEKFYLLVVSGDRLDISGFRRKKIFEFFKQEKNTIIFHISEFILYLESLYNFSGH